MTIRLLFTTFLISGFLLGCSSDRQDKPSGVIPEHQLKALEDAKNTEALLKKSLEDKNEKINRASSGDVQ